MCCLVSCDDIVCCRSALEHLATRPWLAACYNLFDAERMQLEKVSLDLHTGSLARCQADDLETSCVPARP